MPGGAYEANARERFSLFDTKYPSTYPISIREAPPPYSGDALARFTMPQAQYVSPEFLEKLKAELHDLKTVQRRELANRIEAAKALGDLSENAEYHEAKDALGFIEGRILEIDDLLKNAIVIEEEKGGTNVRVGSKIKVKVNGKEKDFDIVGSNEADPLSGKISNESPIGSALIGAKKGDTVSVRTPNGHTDYEILSIN